MPSLTNAQRHERLSERDLVVLFLARFHGHRYYEVKASEIERLLKVVRLSDGEFYANGFGPDDIGVRTFVEAYILGLNNA